MVIYPVNIVRKCITKCGIYAEHIVTFCIRQVFVVAKEKSCRNISYPNSQVYAKRGALRQETEYKKTGFDNRKQFVHNHTIDSLVCL